LRALQLLDEGRFPGEVAREIGVDRGNVRRWKSAVRKKEKKGSAPIPLPGNNPA